MPLLPSHTLLQTYSLTLAITSYFLLTSPLTILNATPLWLLGESMHIRPATFSSDHPAASLRSKISNKNGILSNTINASDVLTPELLEILALVSVILLVASLTQSILCTPLRYSSSDLARLAEKSVGQSHLTNNKEAEDSKSAFAEKLFNLHSTQTLFLTLSALRVLFQGALVAYIYLFHSTRSSTFAAATTPTGILSLLANRIVFTAAMGDMLFWGYMWTVLRDEAREIAGLVGKRQKMEEELEQ